MVLFENFSFCIYDYGKQLLQWLPLGHLLFYYRLLPTVMVVEILYSVVIMFFIGNKAHT